MRVAFVGAVVIVLGACSSAGIDREWDPAYDFSGKSTYAWVEASPGAAPGTMLDRRLRKAVDDVMAARGFQLVGRDEAQFLLSYSITTQDRQTYDTYGYGTGQWWGVDTNATATRRTYTDGTLILDVVDAARNQLVWRGTASGTVDPSAPPDERMERATGVVKRLLKDFPPGS